MKPLRPFTLLILLSIFSFSLEIEYSYTPKRVYENQVFPITFLSIDKVFGEISFNFPNREPISKRAVIIQSGNKTFYNSTLRLQVRSLKFHIVGRKF